MPINILMPALSPTMEAGPLAKWPKAEADTIASGDGTCETETDQTTLQAQGADSGPAGQVLRPSAEREELQLVAEGLSHQRIAEELVISVKTVEAHKAHIMSKLHARNRTDLIRYAIKRGLVSLETPDLGDEQRRGA